MTQFIFLPSARRLMLVDTCIKFRGYSLSRFQTISNGNSSHFMQTISSYLVKISVNAVNYCTIITWNKIVIDNCFCD